MSANASTSRPCEGSNPPPTLLTLPYELLINTMESLPDMATLMAVCHTHPRFQSIFRAHQGSILTGVLRNQIGPQMFSHAVTAHRADELACSTPLNELKVDEMRECCDSFQRLRDDALASTLSVEDAVAISRNHSKVLELTGTLVERCYRYRGLSLTIENLARSLKERPPSADELTRISQAIYLYMMLRGAFVGSTAPPPWGDHDDGSAWLRFSSNITLLQETLAERAFAPWELTQAMAVTGFFRRAICYGKDINFLYFGLSQLHRVICHGPRGILIRKVTEGSRSMLGVLLTRSEAINLDANPDLAAYKPFFAGPGAAESLRVWREMELSRASHVPGSEPYGRYLDLGPDLRLELWLAPLWDYARWREIKLTLVGKEDLWTRLILPCHSSDYVTFLKYQTIRDENILG